MRRKRRGDGYLHGHRRLRQHLDHRRDFHDSRYYVSNHHGCGHCDTGEPQQVRPAGLLMGHRALSLFMIGGLVAGQIGPGNARASVGRTRSATRRRRCSSTSSTQGIFGPGEGTPMSSVVDGPDQHPPGSSLSARVMLRRVMSRPVPLGRRLQTTLWSAITCAVAQSGSRARPHRPPSTPNLRPFLCRTRAKWCAAKSA